MSEVQNETAPKGRCSNRVPGCLTVADRAPVRGLCLGLALFPNRRPTFLLGSSNRCTARSGDAFALGGCLRPTRATLGVVVVLPSLCPIPFHPNADRTSFGGGHLSAPATGAVLRSRRSAIAVTQIRKCLEKFVRFSVKLPQSGLCALSGERFHVDGHVTMISEYVRGKGYESLCGPHVQRSGEVAAWLKSERFVKVTRRDDSSSLTIRNVCKRATPSFFLTRRARPPRSRRADVRGRQESEAARAAGDRDSS